MLRAPFRGVILLYTLLRRFNCRIRQKPLLAQAWLDRHISALAEAHVVLVRLRFVECARAFQNFGRLLPRCKTI